MKKLVSIVAALAASTTFWAQCAFDPTVTPSSLILCPQESDTLWTQAYDSYQWYKGGNPIPGATNQYYVVHQFTDAGNYFSVEATQNNCTEMSPQVLVDSWVFSLPYTITAGDPGVVDMNGVQHNCPGDTVYLIMGMPYSENIQWYDNGNPIPGANDDTLMITQGMGWYTTSGSPAICPNYQGFQNVAVGIQFWPVITPVVSISGNQLVCSPSNASSYQWYLNNSPVQGANQSTYLPTVNGTYSVLFTDGNGCTFMSAPVVYTTGITEISTDILSLYPNPAEETLNIKLSDNSGAEQLTIRDITGRIVLTQTLTGENMITINVHSLDAGAYTIELLNNNNDHLSAQRFIIR